jgi:hypothetical protein
MYKKFKKHLGYYISLITILSFGLILILLKSSNIKAQTIIVFLTVFFYVLWGILHHLINHELTLKIVIEYVLIGALGISILFFMLMGGVL